MVKKIRSWCILVYLLILVLSFTDAFALTFTISDLVGIWYGHHVISGDAPDEDPRWGYGTFVIDGLGTYTATWNSPTATNEVSTGNIQIDGGGIVGLDNDPLIHGVINDTKDHIVLTDGSDGNAGNGLMILVKHCKSKSMPSIPLLLDN